MSRAWFPFRWFMPASPRPTQSALLALGFRSYTDIPALKELEEWLFVMMNSR